MAQATFSVRMDENLKNQFEALCNYFGMNMTTAINIFARAVVKERKIPFEISADDAFSPSNANAIFNALRNQAKENGVNDLSEEEIEEEISKARNNVR